MADMFFRDQSIISAETKTDHRRHHNPIFDNRISDLYGRKQVIHFTPLILLKVLNYDDPQQ
jgi:hypothetical protein